MSAVVPTAWKRPPLTAKASAVGTAASMVVTLALITTRSGLASSEAARAAHDDPSKAAPVKPTDSRKHLRLCLMVITAPDRPDDAARGGGRLTDFAAVLGMAGAIAIAASLQIL